MTTTASQALLTQTDPAILGRIADVLSCDPAKIGDVYPLKQGLTNLSYHFSVEDTEYVYRHPGIGTEKMIDRKAEAAALRLARDLELDKTFIHVDEDKGWKLSRFIPECKNLDPTDDAQLADAMKLAHRLHTSDAKVERVFDFYEEGKLYESLLEAKGTITDLGYCALSEKAAQLKAYVTADNAPVCLSHNDFFYLNFLIDQHGDVNLIDWEYAGMSDYAHDFGTFVVCSELSDELTDRALFHYFGRTPTSAETRHNYAHIALAGWCWYVWSLLKESEGDDVGEWREIYHRYAVAYLDRTLDLYRKAETEG